MKESTRRSCLVRLRRIEGQVRGVARMTTEERYCIDVVTQIQAARAALERVENMVLKDHIETCVEHAIESGDARDQRRKVNELLQVFGRARKERPVVP